MKVLQLKPLHFGFDDKHGVTCCDEQVPPIGAREGYICGPAPRHCDVCGFFTLGIEDGYPTAGQVDVAFPVDGHSVTA